MKRVRRWLFRAPVVVYRAGLGFLLGKRFLLLDHRGRKTGLVRHTVLEVVDAVAGSPVVTSGFGDTSDWFRNIQATPGVTVTWGRRRFPARSVVLPAREAERVFARYRRNHPRLAAFLGKSLDVSIVDDPAQAARRLPVVLFQAADAGE